MIKEKYFYRNPIVIAADCITFLFVSLALYRLTGIETLLSYKQLMVQSIILISCMLFYDILFHTYQSLWRYAAAQEYTFLFLASSCAYGNLFADCVAF